MRQFSVTLSEARFNDGAPGPTSREVRREPLPLGIGKKEALGPNQTVALVLAILVGLAVFALIWRIRKTFGMKD